MKSVTIHNFRSIKEATLELRDYTMLLGANNAGKTNVLTALRIFYENGIKYDAKSDFPKFPTEDGETWMEIQYVLTDDEFSGLKDEYRNPGNLLRVRKYLRSEDTGRVKADQSNIYGYENGILSENLFYGAKNISQAKLGSVIYIPEVTTTDETLKFSGPSPLREILTFVMKRVVSTSPSFVSLTEAFEEFNTGFREETSKDGVCLMQFLKEVNDSLREWEMEFSLDISPIRPEGIIKTLVSCSATDKNLKEVIDVRLLGQGFQRHLIYTLLRLSAQYVEKRTYTKKEFSPELTLMLFEEPEAFLHPGQQERLNSSLKSLSSEQGQQIIVATHSPIFVSRNIEDIPALIKLKRDDGITRTFQVSEGTQQIVVQENNEFAQFLQERMADPSVDSTTKNRIKKILGETEDAKRMEEEAIRYLLWLDSERCCAFFADVVLICEGATEKVFIDYLIRTQWHDLREKRIYVLDAMGKFNIHRYMNLFRELGIYHSVLADKDWDSNVQKYINQFIQEQKNEFTKFIDFFDGDVETFLDVPKDPRPDKGPLSLMWHYSKGKIPQARIGALKDRVDALL